MDLRLFLSGIFSQTQFTLQENYSFVKQKNLKISLKKSKEKSNFQIFSHSNYTAHYSQK